MQRRHVLAGLSGVLLAGPIALAHRPASANLTAGQDNLDFRVYRNGSDIGHHRLNIIEDGNRTTVEIDILLEVGIGPIVLFRYRHANREVWENGEFLYFESQTDDDGDEYAVRAERVGSRIKVTRDHDEDYEFDDLSILPTTYWNAAIANCAQVLDTQKGRIMDVDIADLGWQSVETDAGAVEAQRFDISGDLNLSLWYDDQGRWSKLEFPLKDDTFEYRLA